MPEAFRCPTCDAEYEVERVKTPPTLRQVQVVCVECGGPLRAHEGKFSLRYLRRPSKVSVLPFRPPER
jgi:hypothetical protein